MSITPPLPTPTTAHTPNKNFTSNRTTDPLP